jgi:hypothetical protein
MSVFFFFFFWFCFGGFVKGKESKKERKKELGRPYPGTKCKLRESVFWYKNVCTHPFSLSLSNTHSLSLSHTHTKVGFFFCFFFPPLLLLDQPARFQVFIFFLFFFFWGFFWGIQ